MVSCSSAGNRHSPEQPIAKDRFGFDCGLSKPLRHDHLLDHFHLVVNNQMRIALHHCKRSVSYTSAISKSDAPCAASIAAVVLAQVMEAKVADLGRFERGAPVRIEMLIRGTKVRLPGLRVEHHSR